MASIVHNKVGKYTYLYESESYRDSNGKPQTRKTRIGKIDHKTGETVYNAEYLERVRGTDKEPDFSTIKQYSAKDIRGSTILDYGAYYFFESIATEIGLIDVLKKSVPTCWEKIITLAFYMISTGEPALYCEDWLKRSESLPCGNMSSQKISELLSAATKSAYFSTKNGVNYGVKSSIWRWILLAYRPIQNLLATLNGGTIEIRKNCRKSMFA